MSTPNSTNGVSRRGFVGGALGILGTTGTAPSLMASLQGDFQPQKITSARRFLPARSIQAPDGTIYLLGFLRSTDGGRTLNSCETQVVHGAGAPECKADPGFGNQLTNSRMSTLFSRKGFFLGLGYRPLPVDNAGTAMWGLVEPPDGRCVSTLWRSFDNLKTIEKGETSVFLPEAGKILNTEWTPYDTAEKLAGWVGIFFMRGVVEMPDGSLLVSMCGNFEQDRTRNTDPRARVENTYKMRSFVVRSTDQGKTWRYLSTISAPRAGVVDDTEGPNEVWIERLNNGKLLAVMRTGHYTPMIASWSGDGGETWTAAIDMGLGPGADPCVLKLRDGRLALAYGQLVQRSGPRKEDWRAEDQRRRCQLAINLDETGERWVTTTVADYGRRSAYPTIFEAEPNVIVYQSDIELWRVEL